MKSWMIERLGMLARGNKCRVSVALYFLVPPPLIASNALRAPIQGFCGRGKTAAEWIYFNFKE